MKKSGKHWMRTIALCVVFSLLGGGIVYAAENWANIWVQLNSVNLTVNGSPVTTTNLLYNDTTYVPLRACAEMLGSQVGWDQNTNTASINTDAVSSGGSQQMLSDMKTAAHLAFAWQSLYALGYELRDSIDDCQRYVYWVGGLDATMSAERHELGLQALDRNIETYNEKVDDYEAYVSYAESLGIDPSAYSKTLEYYYDAIGMINDTYNRIYSYEQKFSIDEYEEAFNLILVASTFVNDGILSAYEQFLDVIEYQTNYR